MPKKHCTEPPEPPELEPLVIGPDMLARVGELLRRHTFEFAAELADEFGRDAAQTLLVLGSAMWLGSNLLRMPAEQNATDSVTQLWALMHMPFAMEAVRRQ